MIVYQIGHVPIYAHSSEAVADRGMIADLSWRVPVVDTRLGGVVNLGNRDANYTSQTITVTGDIVGNEDYPTTLVRKEIEILGGQKRIPIIAFDLIDDPYGNEADLVWYISFGTLATYSRNFTLKSFDYADVLPMSMTLVLETAWKPLNTTYWKYIRAYQEYNMPLTVTASNPPEKPHEIKNFWIFYHNPANDETDYYDITGLLTQLDSLSRYGLDWTAIADLPTSISVNTTPYIWNAFPTTLYFFKNLPTTDTDVTVTINQYRPYSSEAMITEVSSFNCQALDELMTVKGYTNLLTTDIIVLGNVRYFPGFVIRSGSILSDVKINATFPGLNFGQLYTETNSVVINSSTTTIQTAMYSVFSRI